ncbi:hypothetical protein LNTAR_25275 [Lentisphaera araneosa HTCC2155]|jgi:hypothetical protein|uniref:AbiEi antitoxin C-terminal domain-containing protein n=1 Tax=Lentisphaera araneosa HTCC2155 TaxID=313628 RepID=A6DS97_9BACT|nr:DUF6088 family protein [Lentisphaera araneosa]EDM25442.1 hypothetical protein LNTAR_25275 [Lentisphaera araneosa HTCC2155]
MKNTAYIREKIESFADGYVFSYLEFMDKVDGKESVIKALNRMVQSGCLCKLSKGKFFKAEASPFGVLAPNQYEIVKDLLEKDGQRIGYLTGLSIFNKLGLTTQLSSSIQIGRNEVRSSFKRGIYSVTFLKQKNIILEENIALLQLLDCLRLIKKIPDSNTRDLCLRLKVLLGELSEEDMKKILDLALKYPPASRALLGAFLCDLGREEMTSALKKSLNPITTYKIADVTRELKSADDWRIQ